MAFNPLKERGIPLEKQLRNWSELNVEPYDEKHVHPYTRCRVIAMNGIEVEAVLFSHHFARNAVSTELKQQLALTRQIEQQQQKAVNWLIPGSETTLEVTIGYEQTAVDVTAWLAQQEPDPYVKQCFEFGLLEDFDHLYRYANLLDLKSPKRAEEIVGGLTEIMPGRPTVAEHRHPLDEVRRSISADTAHPLSPLHLLTITAVEQQVLSFYMNIGNRPQERIARGLYLEIAQIEEQHVTHYESLLDARVSWAAGLVEREYNECYMYYSLLQQETDPRIKQLWELHLNMEIEHLRIACETMRQLDGTDPESILPKEIPEPVLFKSNKDYIRSVLAGQVGLTADKTEFVPVDSLPADHRYFQYQRTVNAGPVPSEQVIEEHKRARGGSDYRLETEGPHPAPQLRSGASSFDLAAAGSKPGAHG
jgi:rubrerythrin